MELQLPPDCLITAIIRNEDVLVPRGATLLQAGDRLILMARTEAFDDLFKRLDVKV
jgi:trk system potassium uptake protein TrkA